MSITSLTHLQRLEAESIHIMREVVAEADNPVMLYSIGKDSAVMLHLALKAFHPAVPPFPLLHVDTRWKFRDMYELSRPHGGRDRHGPAGAHQPRGRGEGHQPLHPRLGDPHRHHEDRGPQAGARQVRLRCGLRRRAPRRGEIARQGARVLLPHRAAPLGPEEPAPRAVEALQRAQAQGRVDPRVPLSNWTELDIWQYIYLENIPIVPLYYAAERPVVERDGTLIMVDDERMPLRPGECR
jgi:sulfate adenylyltransferase subunit 2